MIKGKSIEEQTNQIKAANTLGKQCDERAIEPLIKMLGTGLLYPRLAASKALGAIGSPAIKLLIEQLGKIPETQDTKPPKEAFWDKSYYVHDPAARTLVRIGNIAVPALVDVVIKGNDFKAQQAADALGRIGDKATVEALVKTFSKRTEPLTIWKIVRAIGEIRDKHGTDLFCQILDNLEFEAFIRWEAADGLGKIADPQGVDSLIRGLSDDNEQVRRTSARSLGKIKDKRAIKPLQQLLASLPKKSSFDKKSVYFEVQKALRGMG